MSVAVDARWRVHLPTADATVVRLAGARVRDSDPWPVSRVLNDLLAAGVERADRPHAVGAGRGVPLIHRQQLRWHGVDLLLEAHHVAGGAEELALELPAWDELMESACDEDSLWDVIDVTAAAWDARHGAVGDGEAMDVAPSEGSAWTQRLRRHIALLVPAGDAEAFGTAASCYRMLPRSGLAVMLR